MRIKSKCAFTYDAFTLAEIMIVLTVVGVLTAILLPAAFHATPDENIMKFKKANSTLGTVIRELVNSDKYYLNGDLGVRVDGTLIDGTQEGDTTYFCETFSDMVSIKSKNCENSDLHEGWVDTNKWSIDVSKQKLDEACAKNTKNIGITTSDNVIFFEETPQITYGMSIGQAQTLGEYPTPSTKTTRNFGSYIIDGFDVIYKIFCIDVDGIPTNATEDDCVNECPFGYGIRADGKILPGARADEWINKSAQKEE